MVRAMPQMSLIYYLAANALLMGVANFQIQRSNFCLDAIKQSAKAKYTTLDGLRGFLALSVFFHHAAYAYFLFQSGKWGLPDDIFYESVGRDAVTVFFMITGFLFWSKLIGQPQVDIKKFYLNRALRIYPAYWFSLALILLVVLWKSDLTLQTNPIQLVLQLGEWLSCGLLTFPFVFAHRNLADINDITTWMINSGVTWTLTYELNFYLLIPLLGFLVKPLRFLAVFLFILTFQAVLPTTQTAILSKFLCGMAIAYLYKEYRLEEKLSHWSVSIAIILMWGVCLLTPATGTLKLLLFSLSFIGFVYGNTLFGLLVLPVSRYLGIISYGVYLLHGIVLYVVFRSLNVVTPIKELNPLEIGLLIGGCGVIIVLLSGICYRYIEYPFLQRKQ
jgi:peptidoglycan/LPS O-acetylase OafA/YrhL